MTALDPIGAKGEPKISLGPDSSQDAREIIPSASRPTSALNLRRSLPDMFTHLSESSALLVQPF